MFGIDRGVQNNVGAEEYGLYFSLLSLSILLNILLDAGITNFNNRSIAQNNGLLTEHLSKIVPLKFLLSVIYALFVLGIGFILGYSQRQFNILWVLIINQFLLSFILYLRSNISGLHLFRTDSFLSVLDRFLVIIICSLLLWTNIGGAEFKIEWFVYSQTLAYSLAALIIFIVVFIRSGKIRLQFPLKYGWGIIKQSYPFAILILLMSFFNRFDSVFLERMLEDGKVQVGIYAQSFRILDAANMYSVLVAGMLLPIFSRMLKEKQAPTEMLRLSFSIVIVPALTLSIISFFYNEDIIALLYNEYTEYSSRVFSVLINGFVFISISYIFGTLLTANGSLKQLNLLALITVLLNFSLNLILIPKYKALGSAFAAVSSQSFFALAQLIVSVRIFKIKISLDFPIRLLIFTLLLAGSGFLVHAKITNWLPGLSIILILALIYSWILKILRPKKLYQIIKYDEK